MILIRGIKGESYAKRIVNGIVDCRDVLSAVICPPQTGYRFSDYYEKNLVKALAEFSPYKVGNHFDPQFLHSLLIDYYVPYMYVTYFHILNDDSLKWLDNFEDDYSFIGVNVNLDRITGIVIGNGYFGAPMVYADSINDLKQGGINYYRLACSLAIERILGGYENFEHALNIYNTLTFPLFCRERTEKYNESENEFRIVAFECPRFENNKFTEIQRETVIKGNSGVEYTGIIKPTEYFHLFKANCFALRYPIEPLADILFREQGKITLGSTFKSISIAEVADEYIYIGGKEECASYIEKMNSQKPPERTAEYTIRRKHDISEIRKTIKGYWEVEY